MLSWWYIPYYPVSYMITRNDDQTNLSPDCIAFLYRFWCILENLPRPSRTFSEFLQLRRGVSRVLYFLSSGRTSDHLPSCEGCPNVDAINGAWAFLKDSARLSVMAVGELCSVMVDELLCYCQGYCKLPKKIPGWCVVCPGNRWMRVQRYKWERV